MAFVCMMISFICCILGILVKAGTEVRDQVIQAANALVSRVQSKTHVINDPGMPDFFKNERSGQSLLKNIEKEFNVSTKHIHIIKR